MIYKREEIMKKYKLNDLLLVKRNIASVSNSHIKTDDRYYVGVLKHHRYYKILTQDKKFYLTSLDALAYGDGSYAVQLRPIVDKEDREMDVEELKEFEDKWNEENGIQQE